MSMVKDMEFDHVSSGALLFTCSDTSAVECIDLSIHSIHIMHSVTDKTDINTPIV